MNKQLVTTIGYALLVAGVAIATDTHAAQAVTFTFDNINTNNTNGDAIVNQFSFDVTETNDSKVLFKFSNTGNVESFIRQIYFDDRNTVLDDLRFKNFPDTSSGVTFKNIGENQLNFAQGNNVNFNSSFGIEADKPGSGKDGIDANEFLTVTFAGNYESVLADLSSGDLRVGIHVQGIATANFNSDSFISSMEFEKPEPVERVPEPGVTLALGSLGIGLWGFRRRQQS
ncbi:MAG: PEP-CTERM sorting domain-containing protein [Jaaginema sp. PMC 1079.18]|nr:PEP-CTERM sorting domain-containing protein [Jaaginema sp. PMC 1080.18]MEC4850197.1 PEP-CTERM sorting domain-containing protein [Jaaginema sp. PMC 1079.18]MEC4865290.1 PEP-CTERM sorting domain-containing protein [Jaaginema sp. PMC 1078.18]